MTHIFPSIRKRRCRRELSIAFVSCKTLSFFAVGKRLNNTKFCGLLSAPHGVQSLSSKVSEVLEAWLAVQRNWLYLQPIFESPDINKQVQSLRYLRGKDCTIDL